MNVVLLQPPDPPKLAEPQVGPGVTRQVEAPSWDLLCLDTYIREHTRHVSHFLDSRLFDHLENDLISQLKNVNADAVVVPTDVLTLDSTVAILDVCKRSLPHVTTIISGPFPTRHPHEASHMPRLDYGLCGDSEPILRDLLDNMDTPARISKIPGLIIPRQEAPTPRWASKLIGFSPADWSGLSWDIYCSSWPQLEIKVSARLTRGHSGLDCDRPWPGPKEPLRYWPMEKMAQSFQKAPPTGIQNIFLSDAPGAWTSDKLHQWCAALRRANSIQAWSFQALPATFSDELIEDLQFTQCRNVYFIVPDTDPQRLEKLGCNVTAKDLAHTAARLQQANIEPIVHFWIGGPWARKTEAGQVIQWIQDLNYMAHEIHPFPCHPDAELLIDTPLPEETPELEDKILWKREPWFEKRPTPRWGGPQAQARLAATRSRINAHINRNPFRLFQQVGSKILQQQWIKRLEGASMKLLAPAGDPSDWGN